MKDSIKAEIGRIEGVLGGKIDGLAVRVKALQGVEAQRSTADL
jgi:hypothetical protein